MKSILDRTFQYVPSAQTDLRKTFKRLRREQRDAQAASVRASAEATLKVSRLRPAIPGKA